jgi:hypothetical protein
MSLSGGGAVAVNTVTVVATLAATDQVAPVAGRARVAPLETAAAVDQMVAL